MCEKEKNREIDIFEELKKKLEKQETVEIETVRGSRVVVNNAGYTTEPTGCGPVKVTFCAWFKDGDRYKVVVPKKEIARIVE